MKYVMFRVAHAGGVRYFPIIFGDNEVHAQIAEAIATMPCGTRGQRHFPVPVSAGFCTLDRYTGWRCFGESESLKMMAHPEDCNIINSLPYMHGIGFSPREKRPARNM